MRKRADETAVPMNEETPFHVDNVAETEMDLVSTQHDTAVPDFDPMQEPAWNRPMSEATTSTCTSGYVQDPTFLAIDVALQHTFSGTVPRERSLLDLQWRTSICLLRLRLPLPRHSRQALPRQLTLLRHNLLRQTTRPVRQSTQSSSPRRLPPTTANSSCGTQVLQSHRQKVRLL